jgi:integrase-like protein
MGGEEKHKVRGKRRTPEQVIRKLREAEVMLGEGKTIPEVATTYIEPGCPWQNPWIESFSARFRDEVFDCELFSSILEARVIADVWRDTYNRYHPHSSLGMLALAVFAERWRADHTEGVAMS